MNTSMLRILASVSVFSASVAPIQAHNLDTIATSISFSSDYVETMSQRATLQNPLIQQGDEFWVLLKTTAGPGTATGVGGYQTFYVPPGVEVLDAAYVFPDASDPRGFRNIPMKGQSPIAIGSGSVGAASTPQLIGWELPGLNGLGFKSDPVTATGVDRGTIAGVYADTGIFFSTDPRTAFNSYGMPKPPLTGPPFPMKNNSGDTVGEWFAANINNSEQRNILGVMNLWDSYQLRAYGRGDVSPLIDNNGRGNAPWGLANVVAGPESGYAWEFDYEAYDDHLTANAGDTTGAIRAAIKIGPWNRVQYPGSQISQDVPGSPSNVLGQVGIDASLMGIDPTTIPADATAIRFAIGQLELGRPEFSAVKVRIKITDNPAEPLDCGNFKMHADAFGGDAGGTSGGKDHMWRYFDPTVVTLTPCTLLQKVASKSLVAPGETFYFDITFANTGTFALPNVTITDTLPSGLVHVSAIPAPTTLASPNFTWNVGTVQPGGLVTIRQYVKATGSGTLFNTATARSDGEIVGTAQQSVEVGTRAILQKSKSATPNATAAGETVTYTLEIENIGTGPNGTPLRARDALPAGFTYQSFVGATLNGATIASPTITVNATNPTEPVFTVSQSIQPGKKLFITFTALIGPDVQPGTYFNSFQLEYEGKIVPPIPEAPVTVAGGKIGDTVWYDWDGNGTQDPGEPGIPGVTVELYAADGITLLRTTTTDSNGNYYFPGLIAGTYVVKVVQPAGTTQTGDPDATLDNQHNVILGEDEQYLIADFGYQPTGAGSIGDFVFEDVGNDGAPSASDPGISGVTLTLYADNNGDGIYTPGVDSFIATTTSDGSGAYSFTGLAEGFDYLVVVDPIDSAVAAYFDPNPFLVTTGSTIAVPNLSGAFLDADFGFWKVEPGSIGDTVFLDADGDGLYDPAIDSPLGGVTVTLIRDGVIVATTTSAPDGSYIFENLGPATYSVIVDGSSPAVPGGYAPSVGQYTVSLSPGQNFLDADFPFTPLIAKSVDLAFAQPNDTLNFGVNLNYSGNALLSDVTVRDFLPTGTSFDAAGQGGQLVTFASQPGSEGFATFGGDPIARVYSFQGGSTAFWSYDPAVNAWSTLASAPGTIADGSALTNDGERYIYAFQGGSRAFYRYDAILDIWSDTAVADLPGTAAVTGDGSALVYLDDSIYAFIGGGSQQFWRYDVATNTWTARATTLATILRGGSLATDGENVFGLRGDNQVFWRYNVDFDTWTALSNTGQNIREGAGLVYADDGFFYATTGGGNNRFYRYDIDLDNWTRGQDGIQPNIGGDLATDGINFYVTQGDTTANFVQRFYDAVDTSLAATPGTVVAGGGLTYLESPAGVLTSSFSVSPDVVAVGSPVTVTMTLEATGSLTGVVPTPLLVSGGSATITGPLPASINLTANTPATFTWTVTPQSAGEFRFSASANADGGASFAVASSPTILASPDGQNQFVEWVLGDNQSGSSGTSATAKYLYAFQGGTANFWTYNTAGGAWNDPLNPLNSPVSTALGGGLTTDDVRYIYALQGNSRVFMRYDAISNVWENAGIADVPATTERVVGAGGALTYLNGQVYAMLGNDRQEFWQYDVASNSWTRIADTPARVNEGGALTTDGTNLYAFQGKGTKNFWRYNAATNTWAVLAPVAQNVKKGGALVYANGAIYGLRGDNKKDFWRYNIGANTWTVLAGTPENHRQGAALAYDGISIYATRGDGKPDFWRYSLTSNTWSITPPPNAPGNVNWGGALTFLATGDVSRTVATASPTLVMGVSQVAVRMTITSDDVLNGITADTSPTFTATGGATATISGPTLISPDNNISGPGDPVIYEWIATVTPGTDIGSITFTTTSSQNAEAVTNSVIVSPTLTYAAIVGANPPGVIENTALLNESGLTFNGVPSNITQTATAASIGDFVWADLNGDGIQDPGEFGIGGVTVILSDANGDVIATTTTDATGFYRFFGLEAGDYTVTYDTSTVPSGYFATTATTIPVTVVSGQQFDTADFGLTVLPPGTGSIGDYVWLDKNNDGAQDAGEPGISGITVTLERFIGGEWIEIATTETDEDGFYSFGGLSAADYRVTIDTDSQVTSPYAQGTFNLGDVMAPTYDEDGVSTPHVALVTLATDSTVIDTTDFGYNWSGSIGDFVWWDYNTDGLQNEDPLVGIPNARVQLYFDADFDGVFDRILGDFEILRVFTDANGFYIIPNLPPGNYFVDVYEDSLVEDTGIRNVVPTTDDIIPVILEPGNMNVDTADFGYYEGARVEALVFWDENGNGIRDSGEVRLADITVTLTGTDTFGNPVSVTGVTTSTGYIAFLVPEGEYTISYDVAEVNALYPALGTQTTPTSFEFFATAGEDGIRFFDFGVDNTGAIGDTIFADLDGISGEGVGQGSGDPGLAGVTVNLYLDVDGDGIIDFDAGDLLLATTLTDAQGNYLFTGLPDTVDDQRYVIEVLGSTIPAAYLSTASSYPTGADAVNSTFSTTLLNGEAILTADFGYPLVPDVYYALSGTIYDDNGDGVGGIASNGIQDGDEPGIAGVRVVVAIDTNNDGTYDQTYVVFTDANGLYSVSGILEGSDVRVTVDTSTLPSTAYVQTGDPDGAPLSNVWNITDIQANTDDIDFGYVETLGSIAGNIVLGNGNGIADPAEEAVEGVTVTLTWFGPDGIPGTADDETFTTTTDADGSYEFIGLLPGGYEITTDIPTGLFELADADGFNPNSINVTLALGQDVTDRDFEYQASTLAGVVWTDSNANGLLESGEPFLAGVTVFLDLDGNGVLDPGEPFTTTDTNGAYSFGPIEAGTYQVRIDPDTLPLGSLASFDVDGIDSLNVATVVLGINEDLADINFGYFQLGSISGTIQIDTTGNGEGDTPQADVTVVLLDGAGNAVLDENDQPISTVTDASGNYTFTGVPPGSYQVGQTVPTGFIAIDDVDDGDLTLNGDQTPIVVTSGDDISAQDFVNTQLGTISGLVDADTTGNGEGDAPLEGVTVTLLDKDGNEVATTTTDGDGNYTFTDVPPGTYTVVQTDLPGYLSLTDNQVPVTLLPGGTETADFTDTQPGSITGTVLADTTGDGDGDAPLEGVLITLLDENGVEVATTTTDADGNYEFLNLPPGNYTVVETDPVGYKSITDNSVSVTVLPAGVANADFVDFQQHCPDLWTDWQDKWQGPLGGQTGLTDNPDGDRYSNLLEYAFCMPPNSGARKPFCLVSSQLVAGGVDGVYSRTAGGPKDITFVLDYAASLGNPTVWSSLILDATNTIVTNNGNGTETVRISDLETLTDLLGGEGFVRIRVQLDNGSETAEDATEVLGWVETNLGLCCRTYNNPFLACATFTGTVDSVDGQEIVLSTSAGSTDLSTLLQPGVSYYIEVETGDLEGHRFDIVGATVDGLILADDPSLCSADAPFNTLTGAAPVLLAGDRIAVHIHRTLDGLFPPASFGAGASHAVSDDVQVFAGGDWKIYWLYDDNGTARWVDAADVSMSDAGATVIPPGQGVFFQNRTSPTSLLAYGEVRGHDFHRPLCQGVNLVGGGYPIDQSATGSGSRELNLEDGFFGSRDFKTADSFFIWRTDADPAARGYDTYFLLDGGPSQPTVKRWVKVGDPQITPRDSELLFKRDGGVMTRVASDLPDYMIPSPWTP